MFDVSPPNSHVAVKPCGGSHVWIVPAALPSIWKRPPSSSSPLTGANQRASRSAVEHAFHRSSTPVA